MIRGLPYDAELEYLEGTGTQYIDTGVPNSTDVDISCNFSCDASGTASRAIFGAYNDTLAKQRMVSAYSGWNTTTARIGVYFGAVSFVYVTNNDVNNVTITGNKCYFNGSEIYSTTNFTGSELTLWLFASNNVVSTYYPFTGRIYSCKIYQNGVLVRDLIPVRVGSGASAVGYMYDRVSRRLFGNAGTGDFVLGPDKAVPILSLHRYASPSNGVAIGKMGCTDLYHRITAKDYVQNGLVAMWDGIENAGWGTHSDDTSVTWTDLILGASISFGTWRMRGDLSKFIFVGNRVSNFDRFSFPQSVLSALTTGADTTIEIVCGDPTASGNEAIVAAITDASTFYGQGGVFAGGGTAGIGLRNNLNGALYPSPAVVKTLAPGVMATYSAVVSNGTVYGYRNGEKLNVSLGADTSKVATSTLLQRMYAYANIRLSSRALTADEIARNYRVDKARFNLP